MLGFAKLKWTIAAVLLASVAGLAAWAQYASKRGPEAWSVRPIAGFPHDPQAFTQGLAFAEGTLYEGTGQYGASSIREVDADTGTVRRMSRLNRAYFGEGITILGDRLYQLTWQNETAVVYDLATFEVIETFRYEGEGWGLANDGEHLILSDGSAKLRFINPSDFAVVREIEVATDEAPITRLNELEFIDGEIWANIWYEDRIVRIKPDDGTVLGFVDISNLYPTSLRGSEDVANGIAYNEQADRLFITGKNWPQLFEVEVIR